MKTNEITPGPCPFCDMEPKIKEMESGAPWKIGCSNILCLVYVENVGITYWHRECAISEWNRGARKVDPLSVRIVGQQGVTVEEAMPPINIATNEERISGCHTSLMEKLEVPNVVIHRDPLHKECLAIKINEIIDFINSTIELDVEKIKMSEEAQEYDPDLYRKCPHCGCSGNYRYCPNKCDSEHTQEWQVGDGFETEHGLVMVTGFDEDETGRYAFGVYLYDQEASAQHLLSSLTRIPHGELLKRAHENKHETHGELLKIAHENKQKTRGLHEFSEKELRELITEIEAILLSR